jgi:hypothetical protein
MTKLSTKHSTVATYRLSFFDPKATVDESFLGEAFFDMDDSAGVKTISELTKEATRLGINNPGGQVMVDEFPSHVIPERHKGQLITDEKIVAELESSVSIPLDIDRLVDTQCQILDTQSEAIRTRFGKEAARGAIYGWEVDTGDEFVRVVTKINTDPRYVIVSASYAPFTEIAHEIELYGGPGSSGKRAPEPKRDLPPQLTQVERVQLYLDALNKLTHAFECLQYGSTYRVDDQIWTQVDDKYEQRIIPRLINQCSKFVRAGTSIKEADRELARIVREYRRV